MGTNRFKVRPEHLKGAERRAAPKRGIAAAPGYGAPQNQTDREILVVSLVPEGR